jgi:hypothetical protein
LNQVALKSTTSWAFSTEAVAGGTAYLGADFGLVLTRAGTLLWGSTATLETSSTGAIIGYGAWKVLIP